MAELSTVTDADLSALRTQIDALDRDLLARLNQRAALAQSVGEIKKREGSAAFRPDREAAVIEALRQGNAGPLPDASIAPIWREIMSACRSLEMPTRVAYLGPAGTFSEQASVAFFGSSIGKVACASFDDVFRATGEGIADFGVVPVENSTEGVVARSLDLLLASPLVIVGMTSLYIRHHLMRLTATSPGVAVVCAHPQALAQCAHWLDVNLPHAERRAVASNAEGARLASLDGSLAAIAGERAASEYSLHIVASAIQDEIHNRTRFAVVCDPDRQTPSQPTGQDATSLVLSVENKPGAVHDMLVPLKTHGVSMTRFESRPARSSQWEYFFFIDIVGHREDPAVAAALAELKRQCAFFRVFGSYPADAG